MAFNWSGAISGAYKQAQSQNKNWMNRGNSGPGAGGAPNIGAEAMEMPGGPVGAEFPPQEAGGGVAPPTVRPRAPRAAQARTPRNQMIKQQGGLTKDTGRGTARANPRRQRPTAGGGLGGGGRTSRNRGGLGVGGY